MARHPRPASFWLHAFMVVAFPLCQFSLATYVFWQARQGVFVWWVYPALMAFVVSVFFTDAWINRRAAPQDYI